MRVRTIGIDTISFDLHGVLMYNKHFNGQTHLRCKIPLAHVLMTSKQMTQVNIRSVSIIIDRYSKIMELVHYVLAIARFNGNVDRGTQFN